LGDFELCILEAVGAVDGILTNALAVELADGAIGGLARVGGAPETVGRRLK
jgi:hypothetical protein